LVPRSYAGGCLAGRPPTLLDVDVIIKGSKVVGGGN
jgi:hypothetical protein